MNRAPIARSNWTLPAVTTPNCGDGSKPCCLPTSEWTKPIVRWGVSERANTTLDQFYFTLSPRLATIPALRQSVDTDHLARHATKVDELVAGGMVEP
jgi:hypothetical protein